MSNHFEQRSQGDILIVDDVPQNLELLSDMLTHQGYEVRRVLSGKLALKVVEIDPPELILLDIMMPEIDGYSVCQQLKASPKTATIPVIFLSALDQTVDKIKAFSVGGADYISKPFQIDEVLARIANQLTIVRQQQQLLAEIEQRKQIEIELIDAKEKADQANQAKSEFLAMMSHEIRTPMNGVIGVADLLSQTELNEQQQELVEIIRNSGTALLSIINDILDFSKIEAGKLEIEAQPFSLRTCLEEILDVFTQSTLEKSIDLIYIITPDVPNTIVSDRGRLRQILLNLVGNAVKFTATGTVSIEVSIDRIIEAEHEELKRYYLKFAITDTGIGMSPEQVAKIFTPFEQGGVAINRRYGGTGLGLTISQRLSELMGGTIGVNSQEGIGTTFEFTIEAGISDQDIEPNLNESKPEFIGKKLIIIAQNPTLQQILIRQAKIWGMEVTAVANLQQAFGLNASEKNFDLLICDRVSTEINLPNLIDTIHYLPNTDQIPLIILTPLEAKLRSISDNHITLLSKPLKLSQLHHLCHSIFSGTKITLTNQASIDLDSATKLAEKLPLKILIAEDVTINQKIILKMLEILGYKADTANNGLEVIEALSYQKYDIIFMDVQMPEMDGLETTRCLRHLERDRNLVQGSKSKSIWIIALTANAMTEEQQNCFDAGMNDYLSKPLRLEELTQALINYSRFFGLDLSVDPQNQGLSPQNQSDRPTIETINPRTREEFQRTFGEGSEEMWQEFVDAFLEETPRQIQQMQNAIDQNNSSLLSFVVHSLKGLSLTIGATYLSKLCQNMEHLTNAGTTEGCLDILNEMKQEYQEVEKELRAIVS